ncbi:MAG: lipoprotein-releasing ABC transporter permease subunit [Desulfovibrio sp.]|jgi:lipoprotein-releasing system permease protein|nr:lipoprotein-releasing ABC transporter permease subunit [Desulfovibrio sp.]
MSFELFVARRYLFARRGQAFISVISWISVAGVALGVASLIVVMGVMNGFTTDLRDKIIGMSAHAVVYSSAPVFEEDENLEAALRSAPGITALTPFIHSGVLLSGRSGGSGVYLRGVDPKSAAAVLGGLKNMTRGKVGDLDDTEGLPGIIIGEVLADKLAVDVGGRINVMAPSGRQSAAGFSPRIMPFRVVGLFRIGLADYDSALAFVNLSNAREVLGRPDRSISGIETAVDDVYAAGEIMRRALSLTDRTDLYVRTWQEMNANLFAALKLEKAAMAVILTLVVLVGSFSIVTALVMLVMEKKRDIAILMSMGARAGMVRRIFTLQGLLIGCMGTTAGMLLGLGCCMLLKRYKFIELPRGVYSLDYLPVLLQWQDVLLTGLCAMLLCFFATLYPARQAAGIEPVEALRHE